MDEASCLYFCSQGNHIVTRREKIEAMLADSPQDPFLNYALALEWEKEDQPEKSLTLFRTLMESDPPYVPAFFMAGQLLVKLDRLEEAATALTRGATNADAQGDDHAAAEMRAFLATFSDGEITS